jgi:hypothetical protein
MLFKETSLFTKEIRKLIGDGEYLEIQKCLLNNPKHGKVIKGTGGIRRLDWSLDTHGKKDGIRIIYLYSAQDTFLMLRALHLHEDL